MSSERLNALLEQARRDFRKHATEQRQVIRGLCSRASNGDEGALVELQRIAHQFHGTAGTLGYGEVGEAAKDVEAAIGAGEPLDEISRRCGVLQERIEAMS